jgi:hypothetical protein
MEPDAPHGAGGSAGMLLNKLKLQFVLYFGDLAFFVQVTMMSACHFV